MHSNVENEMNNVTLISVHHMIFDSKQEMEHLGDTQRAFFPSFWNRREETNLYLAYSVLCIDTSDHDVYVVMEYPACDKNLTLFVRYDTIYPFPDTVSEYQR